MFKIKYPLTPQNTGFEPMINQGFGSNAAYYARFLDSSGKPEKGHPGIDFMAAHGTPVYAAHDGFAFYVGPDDHGGDGVYVRTLNPELDGTYYTTIYWHMCSIDDEQYPIQVGRIGRNVKQGDLLGYSDNTGAPFESTGDHLHFGLAPCDVSGMFLYSGNGYGGCIDPQPFFEQSQASNEPLSASDQIAVLAAQKLASGNTQQANILFALSKFLKAFGK